MSSFAHLLLRSATRWLADHARWPGAALAAGLLSLLVLAGCQADTGQWQSLSYPFPTSDTIVVSMAADPHVPQLFYAGTSNGQVLRLRIESLGAVPGAGLPANAAVSALYADPAQSGHVLAGTSRGNYLSTDYGESWRAFGTGLPADDGIDALVAASASSSDASSTLYAGSEQHGVYLSRDAGATWTAANTGLPAYANVYGLTDDASSNTIYAALVGHGVYASNDGGQTWAQRGAAQMAGSDAFAVLVGPKSGDSSSAILLAGTNKGLFSSTDGGQNWRLAGLNSTRVIALTSDPTNASTVYAGTSSANNSSGTVYRSTDGGAHWSVLAPGLSHSVAAIVVLADKQRHPVIFAASGLVLRYPGLGGATGGPLSTILTIAIFLGLLVFVYWLLRRTRRQLLVPAPATRSTNGSGTGSTTAGPPVPPALPRTPRTPRTTATGQVIPTRDDLTDEVPNPWTGEAAEGGNGSAARHPELN